MRRTSLLLALAAVVAAAPLAAQGVTVATPTYSLELPAAFGPAMELPAQGAPVYDVRRARAEKEGWLLVAMASDLPLPPGLDTVQRRVALQGMRAGLGSAPGMEMVGEPEPFSTAEMLGLRTEIRRGRDGAQGWMALTVPRTGRLVAISVMLAGDGDSTPRAVADAILATLRPGPALEGSGAPADMLSWLEGTWNWTRHKDPCAENPFTLHVNAARDSVLLTYQRPLEQDTSRLVYGYAITDRGEGWVRGALIDAVPLTPSAKPAVWDFVYTDDDHFCWRSKEWNGGGCTAPLVRVRCPAAPAGTMGAALLPRRRPAPSAGA